MSELESREIKQNQTKYKEKTMSEETLKTIYADLIEWQKNVDSGFDNPLSHLSHSEARKVSDKISSLIGHIEIENETIRSERSWKGFVKDLAILNDPLLEGLFKQMRYASWNYDTREMRVTLNTEHLFFSDFINETEAIWKPVFRLCMGTKAELVVVFVNGIGQQINTDKSF